MLNRGYSYWSQVWVQGRTALTFAGGAGAPEWFQVNLDSGGVLPLGPLIPIASEGEGWYLDSQGWVSYIEGNRLRHVNPLGAGSDVVLSLGGDPRFDGCDLWQPHSSPDGQTHSATVRRIVDSGSYPLLGTVVMRRGRLQWYPADGYALDESALAGDYVVIKSSPDNDNLVIHLDTGEQRWLAMAHGALGHSDCGENYMVGADRINGTCAYIDLTQPLAAGRPLYSSWAVGHVALKPGICLVSDATTISRVALDGSGVTPVCEHGEQGDPGDYDHQVKANLSPDGTVACYVANGALSLVEIP